MFWGNMDLCLQNQTFFPGLLSRNFGPSLTFRHLPPGANHVLNTVSVYASWSQHRQHQDIVIIANGLRQATFILHQKNSPKQL